MVEILVLPPAQLLHRRTTYWYKLSIMVMVRTMVSDRLNGHLRSWYGQQININSFNISLVLYFMHIYVG